MSEAKCLVSVAIARDAPCPSLPAHPATRLARSPANCNNYPAHAPSPSARAQDAWIRDDSAASAPHPRISFFLRGGAPAGRTTRRRIPYGVGARDDIRARRSEERRVGKECRARRARDSVKKNEYMRN